MKVRTPFTNKFNVPHQCVACGAAAGEDMIWKIYGMKSNWIGKPAAAFALELPLCPACHEVSRNKKWAKFASTMGAVLPILLCLVMWGLAAAGTIENLFLGAIISMAVIAGVVLLAGWLANVINQRGFTPEQRERRKTLMKSARVASFRAPGVFDKTGEIIFQFENNSFAAEFAPMNAGQILVKPGKER